MELWILFAIIIILLPFMVISLPFAFLGSCIVAMYGWLPESIRALLYNFAQTWIFAVVVGMLLGFIWLIFPKADNVLAGFATFVFCFDGIPKLLGGAFQLIGPVISIPAGIIAIIVFFRIDNKCTNKSIITAKHVVTGIMYSLGCFAETLINPTSINPTTMLLTTITGFPAIRLILNWLFNDRSLKLDGYTIPFAIENIKTKISCLKTDLWWNKKQRKEKRKGEKMKAEYERKKAEFKANSPYSDEYVDPATRKSAIKSFRE